RKSFEQKYYGDSSCRLHSLTHPQATRQSSIAPGGSLAIAIQGSRPHPRCAIREPKSSHEVHGEGGVMYGAAPDNALPDLDLYPVDLMHRFRGKWTAHRAVASPTNFANCYRIRFKSPNSCQRYFLAIAS